ncbi:CLUMA_CG003317, isoform A [Clunio marinus]|uniref:CLUMA_CG003317, isoform A n=1 Tax=Clunio marinus TaxID=568069 RepID=A0A1J1HSR9_9DIPT|nr:CLUMA_CG003317, isoform A [Clunio marinus]
MINRNETWLNSPLCLFLLSKFACSMLFMVDLIDLISYNRQYFYALYEVEFDILKQQPKNIISNTVETRIK